MNNDLQSDRVFELMRSQKFEQAEPILEQLIEDGEHDPSFLLALARCRLALQKTEAAADIYHHLLQHADEFESRYSFEAALVLDKSDQAAVFFQAALQQAMENNEFLFLAAAYTYQLGQIKKCSAFLSRAIELDFEWDDDDPLDHVLQQILPIREFHDFEQIYLDCHDRIRDDVDNPQNRWLALNMPTWDLLKASAAERQTARAKQLAGILSPHFDENFLAGGKNELWRIVNDMGKNKENQSFVEKAREFIRNGHYGRTARLTLSIELEHLSQFASFFGLTTEEVNSSKLQQLIGQLPYRLAVGLIFLYSVSENEEKFSGYELVKLPDDIFAGLIAACFISFYQQVERFRPNRS